MPLPNLEEQNNKSIQSDIKQSKDTGNNTAITSITLQQCH